MILLGRYKRHLSFTEKEELSCIFVQIRQIKKTGTLIAKEIQNSYDYGYVERISEWLKEKDNLWKEMFFYISPAFGV